MESQTLFLILGVVAAFGVAWYVYQEQQARLLRTRVVELPGCLRFEANGFFVEMQQSAKQIKVHAEACQLARTPLAGGAQKMQHGPLDATLPAAGLQIDVARGSVKAEGQSAPVPTGFCTITFTASDELTNTVNKRTGGHVSVLTIDQVPVPVAAGFQSFANRVDIWAEKITTRLQQDHAEEVRKEEEAAKAALAKQLAAQGDGEPVDMAVQIEMWRKAAGFSGSFSDVSTDDKGRVVWFIDFCDDGRITLHANKRTIHTTLRGATITALGAELEIGVRDDYWTEDDPVLAKFLVLQGLPPDERRAWRDRLEKTRDTLDSRVDRGY